MRPLQSDHPSPLHNGRSTAGIKFTIAVPTYNAAGYLGESVRSIFDQSFARDFELILSDDSSSDGTAEALNRLAAEAPPHITVRVLPPVRRMGLTKNWNRCVREASGDVIVLFHQDDVLESDYLVKVDETFARHPGAGMVHAAYHRVDKCNEVLDTIHPGAEWESGDEFVRRLWTGNVVCCPSVAIPRRTYAKIGDFDARFKYCVDYEMWCRIGGHYPIACVTSPCVRYRVHPEQETSRMLREEDPRRRIEQFLAPLAALQHSRPAHPTAAVIARWRRVLGEASSLLPWRWELFFYALGFAARSPSVLFSVLRPVSKVKRPTVGAG